MSASPTPSPAPPFHRWSRSSSKGTSAHKPPVRPEPGGLVPKLAGQLGPRSIGDGLGEALVADQVGHRKIFDGQPAVGLGELARDLMEEASANVGNAVVLPGQRANGFQPVSRTPLSARERVRTPPQPATPASQRSRSTEAADLDAVGVSNNRKDGKARIYPDEPPTLARRSLRMAQAMMVVRGLKVQAHIPSVNSPRDSRGHNSGARSHDGLTGA
jgi:hypothetical protein